MASFGALAQYRQLLNAKAADHPLALCEELLFDALREELANETAIAGSRVLLSYKGVESHCELLRLSGDALVCRARDDDAQLFVPRARVSLRLLDEAERQSYLYQAMVKEVAGGELRIELIGQPVVLRWTRGRAATPRVVEELEHKLSAA